MGARNRDRKQRATRMVALAIAVVMVGSVVAAAILSQIW